MRPIIIASFVILIVLLSMSVFAENHVITETKRNDFNARLSHISCRIDLTKKQIDLLSSTNTSIGSYKAALDADLAKLKELASAFNNKEFSDYYTTTFKDNLRNAVKAIKDVKLDVRKSNLTREEKTSLRTNHKTAIAEFADCVNKADKELGEKRAGHLNAWLNRWNNIIAKMKEKGYDTSEMESVVSDAQSKLLPALEEIKNASTKEARKTAMQNARNLHLHLWARFEIARVLSYLISIEDEAIEKGYQTEVNAIKAKLTGVSNLVVAGKKYGPGEFDSVWKAIKEATQMLKELNRKLKE